MFRPIRTHRPTWASMLFLFAVALVGCGETNPPTSEGLDPTATASGEIEEKPAATVTDRATVEELRQRARDAFAGARLVAPAEDNALAINLELMARDPQDDGARQAVADLFPAVVAAVESALEQENFDEVERLLQMLEQGYADSPTAARMKLKLQAARIASSESVAAEEATKERLVATARSQASPAGPGVADNADAAKGAEVAPARAVGISPPEPIEASPGSRAVAAEPPDPREADTTSTPRVASSDSTQAPSVAEAASATTASTYLGPQVLKQVDPDYPPQARSRRLCGWVDLEFVVTADGTAKSIRVVGSQPQSVFDRSAQRALSRWKFKAAQRNGTAEAAKLRTRINFSAT